MGIAGLVGLAVVMAARSRRDDTGSAASDDQSSTWQDDGGAWRDDDEALQQDDAWADDGTTGRMLPGLLAGAAEAARAVAPAMRHPDAVSRVTAPSDGARRPWPRPASPGRTCRRTPGGRVDGHLQEKIGTLKRRRACSANRPGPGQQRGRTNGRIAAPPGGRRRNHAEQGSSGHESTNAAGGTDRQPFDVTRTGLVLGGAAFALGAIAGMSMPRIEATSAALGKARDTLIDAAGRAVDQAAG